MDNNDKQQSLITPLNDLSKSIIEETDIDKLKTTIDLFNINLKKKEILRNQVLSDLQEKALSQMSERLDKRAGEFSNKDLLDYYKVLKETSSVDTNLDNIPQIQINQQNIINVDDASKVEQLDRQSREKITSVIEQILSKYTDSKEDIIDVDIKKEEDNINEEK